MASSPGGPAGSAGAGPPAVRTHPARGRFRHRNQCKRKLLDSMEISDMPLKGEYEPSAMQPVRDQVELYESSGGTEGLTLNELMGPEAGRGLPVVILTTLGAKSGKIRKSPVMRVEHDGSYVAVASMGG